MRSAACGVRRAVCVAPSRGAQRGLLLAGDHPERVLGLALLGPWLAQQLGLAEPFMITVGGHPFPVLWSIIGAALFVAIIHLFSRRA